MLEKNLRILRYQEELSGCLLPLCRPFYNSDDVSVLFYLQISDWFTNSGKIYLSHTELGDNIDSAQSISTEHDVFEQDSMRIQGELLQLVRTSDQLSHTANVDVTSLRQRLQAVDELAQDFMLRMDARRKNIATAINFYRLASKVRYQHPGHDRVGVCFRLQFGRSKAYFP